MTRRTDLIRGTILWLGAVGWIAWSYLVQDPAPDPWATATRSVFTMAVSVVIVVVSFVLALAWIAALRPREAAPGEDPGAAPH